MEKVNLEARLEINEADEIRKILEEKYGWEPEQWGGLVTGGYRGPIEINGIHLYAEIIYSLSVLLRITSENPVAEEILAQTELKKYLEKSKFKKTRNNNLFY